MFRNPEVTLVELLDDGWVEVEAGIYVRRELLPATEEPHATDALERGQAVHT